ncbi:MAG: response regulator [Actinomycetota bacterium]
MSRTVLAAVEDLLFRSKISEAARAAGIEVRFPRTGTKLLDKMRQSPPDLLILDLNSSRFEPLELLRTAKSGEDTREVPVIGFLSHMQGDLALAAREAGCDRVMARSAFVQDLPKIIAGAEVGR